MTLWDEVFCLVSRYEGVRYWRNFSIANIDSELGQTRCYYRTCPSIVNRLGYSQDRGIKTQSPTLFQTKKAIDHVETI